MTVNGARAQRRATRAWLLVAALAGALAFASAGDLALAEPASHIRKGRAKTINGSTILAHELRNRNGSRVIAWFIVGKRIAITYRASTDVAVVHKHTLTYWSDGRLTTITRYHYGGLWHALYIRFGVTQGMITRSLSSRANTVELSSPLARKAAAASDQPPPVTTTVDDYADNLPALVHAAPFAIRYAGPSVLEYRLAHGYIASVNNPARSKPASGPIVTIVYSSDPAKLGAGDHQLTLNFASKASSAGQANATFLGGHRPSIKANGIVAYKANENQIVFDLGQVVGVITSTLQLTDSQWKTIVSALRAP